MEEHEIIKNEILYISNKTNNSEFKRDEIISNLEQLLNNENRLKDFISRFDELNKIVNKSTFELAVSESLQRFLGNTYIKPYDDAKDKYKIEYYNFLFKIHQQICAPNLFDKKMLFFNYQIPLGYDYQNQNYIDLCVDSDDVTRSESIDTEFYQILILQDWYSSLGKVDFEYIKNRLFNLYDDFSHSDIVVTKSSKGKSRVENSFDIIKRTFKKIGIIDKKEYLTYFGLFIVKLIQFEHQNIRPTREYRGIKSINQLLAKPINDLIFHFDLNDFENLNLTELNQNIDDLKAQIELYKKDAKNIAILNLPNYSRRQ